MPLHGTVYCDMSDCKSVYTYVVVIKVSSLRTMQLQAHQIDLRGAKCVPHRHLWGGGAGIWKLEI